MSYLNHKPGSLEEIIKEKSQHMNDSAYQDLFKKELQKAGKGIGAMSNAEKTAFFNKLDKMHKGKNEDTRDMVREPDEKAKKEAEQNKNKKTTDTGSKPTEIDTKPEISYNK